MATVMVVDDEDVLVEMLVMLVEELGHGAVTATNGHEALARLATAVQPPALIISDVMMPRMSGVDFARAVRDNPAFADIPIILMSAAGRPPGPTAAQHFIQKPWNLDEVAGLIEHYTGRRS